MAAAMAKPMLMFFFFNDTATTEIYTLSLHDALPISTVLPPPHPPRHPGKQLHQAQAQRGMRGAGRLRSEEHTSELQSRRDLVCRLLLEKKKKKRTSLANFRQGNTTH